MSDQGPDSQASRLFKDSISRLEAQSIENPNTKSIPDLTGKVVKINKNPVAWGAICAIWRAELYGKRVSVYSPRAPATYNTEKDEDTILKVRPAFIFRSTLDVDCLSFRTPQEAPCLGLIQSS